MYALPAVMSSECTPRAAQDTTSYRPHRIRPAKGGWLRASDLRTTDPPPVAFARCSILHRSLTPSFASINMPSLTQPFFTL
jgi:hypothetical protein